ncbi:cytochrome P450 [Pestalotiopsis sp. NC0098]|nr:cytochrome P450 [Pestalotiopsis sp. NC0098]
MDITVVAIITATESLLLRQLQDATFSDLSASNVLTLFLVQYVLLKYYRLVLYPNYFSPLRHLPGPSGGHLFLGQTVNILRAETPVTLFNEWMHKWPDAPFIRYLGVGNQEFLLANSPAAYKAVLQTHCYSFRKPDWFIRMTKEVIGIGLLSLEGEAHRSNRKMMNIPFAASNICKLEPLFKEKARGIGSVFDSAIRAGDDKGKTGVIECTETFSKATLDIMGVSILGKELSHLNTVRYKGKDTSKKSTEEEYSFAQAYHIFFAPGPVGKLLTYFNGFIPLRWLPLEANREFKFAMWWLNNTLARVRRERFGEIETAKAQGTYESSNSRDLTTFMVEESLPGGSITGLSEEVFVGHLLQFMAAGHDTSANVLSWSLLIMAEHQNSQQSLRNEMLDLFRTTPDPTYSQIDSLTYLENFIKETLRVYSPATTYHKQSDEDLIIEGHLIPKGTCFDIAPSMAMFNPLIWGQDSHEVNPDRWNHLTAEQANPYAFGAFSNGPRICIGKAFAMMEIKTILIELVRNYRFLKVEKNYTVENPNLTLRPAGLEIRLEKIKQ